MKYLLSDKTLDATIEALSIDPANIETSFKQYLDVLVDMNNSSMFYKTYLNHYEVLRNYPATSDNRSLVFIPRGQYADEGSWGCVISIQNLVNISEFDAGFNTITVYRKLDVTQPEENSF